MTKNNTQHFAQTKKHLFFAISVLLALSVILQPLVIAQSVLPANDVPVKAKRQKNGGQSISHPASEQSGNNKLGPLADCSSQTSLRQEISKRWRFFVQPIPPFLPGLSIPGISRKPRKTYEELYWGARALEQVAQQLLREARKETDNNRLSAACSLLDKELQFQAAITNMDATAINVWNGFLDNAAAAVKLIRDTCIVLLEVLSPAAPARFAAQLLILSFLNSLFQAVADNSLLDANVDGKVAVRVLIMEVIIPTLLDIKFFGGAKESFNDLIYKNIQAQIIHDDPGGIVKLVKQAFKFFYGDLNPALGRRINLVLGSALTAYEEERLKDALTQRIKQFSDNASSSNSQQPGTVSEHEQATDLSANSGLSVIEMSPVNTATEVSVSLPTITLRFDDTIQAANVQAQLIGYNGTIIPLNYGVIGETLFFNLLGALQANTSYTLSLQAGSVQGTTTGALNQALQWSFVTDDSSLTSGSSTLVANTGGVGLHLRSSPSTSAGIITTLAEGTRVTVTGNSVQASGYTWYPVQTQSGQTGWSATGNWLTAVDQYGFRQGGDVNVSNTSGFGLRLRVDPGESSPIITTLSDGTTVKLTGDPVYADGYSWFPVQTADGVDGSSAVARWLIPYSQSAASQLVIRTMAASTTSPLDWGQSVTFDFLITDGNGLPVSGVTVSGQNNLISNIFLAPSTDANGHTSYTTTVPSGHANGTFSILASAMRSGFSNSLSVTRNIEVSHGCSYQVYATDSTFSSGGGSGSLSVITQPGCGWSVPQYPSFVTLTSPDNGFGDGEVAFNVSANTSTVARTGNMIVAGATVAINQDGAPASTQFSVGTDPDGLAFTVDGQTYTARQSFAWTPGSSHTVSTSSPQTIGVNQFTFAGWSDSGTQTHSVTASNNPTLTASFDLPASTNIALDYSWQTRTTSIVHGWGAAAVAPGDGFLYVLGGSTNGFRFSRFDPVSNTWTQLPSMPSVPVIEAAAAMLAGKIYVYGGYTSTIMQVYDVASGQWLSNKTGPYPVPVRGASFVVIGGELYAVGGADINLNSMSGLKKYNPSNDTWTQLADMPTPRASGATTLVDGKIYVAGGNAAGYGTASVNIYDPQTNTWSVGTSLPDTRIQATAIAVNSRIYVLGGSNGSVETRSVLEYNPVSDVWRELSPFNQGRYGAVGAFMRGKLYVIGGEDATNHTAFANLEEGIPSAWAPILSFGQASGTSSGNSFGFVNLSISNPPNDYTPITMTSSDPSILTFPFTYNLAPGQTSAQITYRTGYAGGPVTIIAELPDNFARVRAYKQITTTPGFAAAVTQAATDVTVSSASLNGTVNSAGSSTTASFEWGLDPNLNNPQTTTQVNAGGGLTSVSATFPLNNLQAGTSYYYRMVATNGAGTVCGTILSFTTANNPVGYSISGRVVDGSNNGISGVTMSLDGTQTTTSTTDASGNYSFTGLPAGGNYTVTPSKAGYSCTPASRPFPSLSSDQSANFTASAADTSQSVNQGDVIISEFRLRGSAGENDEFVELYNTTSADIIVGTTDSSSGWTLSALDVSGTSAKTVAIIPLGARLPAHGHYLITNGITTSGPYSLATVGDLVYATDIGDNTGLALFRSADPSALTLTNRLDAVGFSGFSGTVTDLYREGSGLMSIGSTGGEYSFVRKLATGVPQDTGDNAADFMFISTTGDVFGGVNSVLGAPGPENSMSPIQRNAQIKASLIDPQAGSTAAPNRERNSTTNACGGPNCALGTLTIRRKFTNRTGQPVTALRFRVADITTFNSPGYTPGGGQADLRALNSTNVTVSLTGGGTANVFGTSVEQPPVQQLSGGLNTTMVVALPAPIAANASVNVQFVLGVQLGGGFRFLVNVEALTSIGTAPSSLKNSGAGSKSVQH
jgi:N-acetylneuraminic acid mutarotase